jgi:predicted Zn-dependent peptidase
MIAGALPAQNVSIPEYRREILDNGLVVLLMEYHKLPLIELRLAVRGGYSYDPAGYEGRRFSLHRGIKRFFCCQR